ncbi:MAG: M56 family metallopeptidase [Bacteroidota bacterium]
MLASFIHTLESIGLQSLDAFWSPLLIWLLLALLVVAAINTSQRLASHLHYHIRAGLILSLPVGIMVALLAGWVIGLNSGVEAPTFLLVVIETPFSPVVTADPNAASSVEWIPLMLGAALVILLCVSVVRMIYLFRHWYTLTTLQGVCTDATGSISEKLNRANRTFLNTLRYQPRLLTSPENVVPYTHGYRRPVIVIPDCLVANHEQLNLTIRHELIHIQRGDSILNLLVTITCELLWFVPLLNPLRNQFKLYREISCDQDVFEDPELSRKSYAELLVHLSSRTDTHQKSLLGMSVEPSTLKTRIHAMKTEQMNPTPGKATYITFGIALFGIVFAMSCTEMQSNQNPLADTEPVTSEAIEAEGDFDGKTVYVVVETMPELIGGLEGIQEKLVYPEEAREAGTEGRVYIQFVVNELGDVEFPRIIRGIGHGADEEALRVVRDAKFNPARQRGEPVNVQYSLPIEFELGE